MANFVYSQSFCQKSAERKSPKNFFFIFLTWDTNPGFTSNKPTHYLLDSDFKNRNLGEEIQVLISRFDEGVCPGA